MFNNIIYFIVVLLLFNTSSPVSSSDSPPAFTLAMFFLTWLVFAGYCRWLFKRLQGRVMRNEMGDGRLTGVYQSQMVWLSALAIVLFALDVYMFNLKYWLQTIPGLRYFSVLQGLLALTIFILYLVTIWYFAHPVYMLAFRTEIKRRLFILSNVKLNMPIIFPWVILSFVYDLIALTPLAGPERFFNEPMGQILFFASFLIVLMIFMPYLIQFWWGCKPFETSDDVRELKTFLREMGFKYRNLLRWPIFEGRMMTAGIMGIVPRYRYILVTDALMEVLSLEELKAVMAHEVGHAKYRHMIFYIIFILGFMVLSFGLFQTEAYPVLITLLMEKYSLNISTTSFYYLILALPLLITLIVYFRFVMGFFMRNFERQADLHSASTIGSAEPTISSLEKIALLSGKIRDLPSWHHFSIKERVDYLRRFISDKKLARKHNRFVALTFAIYLVCLVGLGYLFNFSPMKQNVSYLLMGEMLNRRIAKEPNNIALYENLAMVFHRTGKHGEAIAAYERILELNGRQPLALNNLAWLLVSTPDENLRQEKRALTLARRAVALERSSVYLDTLAEAYYVNGFVAEAVKTIEEALSIATEGAGYYKKQRRKFIKNLEKE